MISVTGKLVIPDLLRREVFFIEGIAETAWGICLTGVTIK